ncbi:Glycosylphosphatidylinositol specific phospholipase D1 [Globomyces sp. JEL0801]|nr:Glycosylphosphatidylinositol specific phospholipase D1 [Globomyces sp. JEL0801]
MQEEVQTLPITLGVHSMAVSVNQCWKELINWLERGELTTACLPFKSVSYSRAKTNIQVSPNDSSQNCNEFSRNWVMKLLEKGSTSIRAGPSVLLQGMCMVLRSRVLSHQQSRMELFKNMINISFQNVISNLREFFHRMADPTVSASNQTTVLYTDMDYAMLGASVANGDFNGDGIKELVVGSPGYSDINFPQCGAIFYFPNGVSKRTAYDNIDGVAKIIVGPKGFSNQFGYSIAAVDLNHDGIDDLAISAPFYGGKDDDFSGAVFVLFGKKGVGLRLDGAWDMIIYGLKDTNNSSATQNFEVFGHILKGIDVNDDGFQDLVVGSPFTSNKAGTQKVGKFQVFLSKIGYSSQMTSDDSSWTIYGSQDYEWFGMDFSKIDDQICVGSPGYNTYDIPQSGKVSCFKLPHGNTVRPSLQYEILSSEKFAQFGWSISLLQLGQNSLYMVGSPYEGLNTGHSSLLDFPELYDTDSNSVGKVSFIDSSGNIKSSLKGFSTFGNFGKHCIQLTNDSILISEPGYLTERGRLYQSHIPLISSIPIIKSAQKIWLGDLPKEKFGNAIIVMDLNNDGKKDIIASSVNNFQSEDSWSSGLTGGKLTIIWGR